LPPVVFRETDPGKLQPLPEVQGKGKEKVDEEQAAQVLLNLQTLKKKSSVKYNTKSDEEVPLVVKSGAQDEGQAGPNPGNDTVSQPQSTPVHAEPNLEHTNVEATDALSQPQHEQMDEGFTATVYPNVQENLKLTADEPVIPEEPPIMVSVTIHQDTSAIPPMTSPVIDLVSRPDSPNVHRPLPTTATATATTTTTITMLPLPPQPQQDPSDPTLLKHIGVLEQHIADLVDANQALEERLDKHGSRLYRLENQYIPNQVRKAMDEIVTDAINWAMQALLRERFRDLPKANMKEILHNRMWESKSYQTHEDHMMLYEALEKSMARDNHDQLLSDLAKARKKKKKR
ncbi:hypothetical protein Tco_1551905, partial [Tanacetum coccineum]